MPATTQAAMSNMIVCAMEAIERGDFDDQNAMDEGRRTPDSATTDISL